MAGIDNLQPPWKPGESGNPSGSSKKQRFTNLLIKKLDASPQLEDDFIEAGIAAAKAQDFNFWKYLYERIEGKIPDVEPTAELSMESAANRLRERKARRKKKEE